MVASGGSYYITIIGAGTVGTGALTVNTGSLTGGSATMVANQSGIVSQVPIIGDQVVTLNAQNSAGITGAVLDTPLGTSLLNQRWADFQINGNIAGSGAVNCFTPRYVIKCTFENIVYRVGTGDVIIEGDRNAPGGSAGCKWINPMIAGAADVAGGYIFHHKYDVTDSMMILGNPGLKEVGVYTRGGDHKFYNTHPTIQNPNGLAPFVIGTAVAGNSGSHGVELFGAIPDTPTLVQHVGATGTSGSTTITDPQITVQHQGLPINDGAYANAIPAGCGVGAVTQTTFDVPGGTFVLVNLATGNPVAGGLTTNLNGFTLNGCGVVVQPGTVALPNAVNIWGGEWITPGALPNGAWTTAGGSSISVTLSSVANLYVGMQVQDTTTPANFPASGTVYVQSIVGSVATLVNPGGPGFPAATATADALNFSGVYGLSVGKNTQVNVYGMQFAANHGQPWIEAIVGVTANVNWVNLESQAQYCLNQLPATQWNSHIPEFPTATVGDNSTQGATTAFVTSAVAAAGLPALGTAGPLTVASSSSTTELMAGLGVTFTPGATGKVVVEISACSPWPPA